MKADKDVLWMSTDDGLYCYDMAADSLWKSPVNDPSRCGAFYVRSGFRTSKGELLFGGTDGFILFRPEDLRYDSHKPRVFFVDLQINDHFGTGEAGKTLAQTVEHRYTLRGGQLS